MRQTFRNSAVRSVALAACAWLGVLSANQHSLAQDPFGSDDPFGNATASGTDPFGNPLTAPNDPTVGGPGLPPRGSAPVAGTALAADESDPVVLLLRSSPPKTPEQWADALTWMARIKRWDEVKRLLDQLQAANWPLDQQALLARAGGAALWLRLRTGEAALTAEQSELIGSIVTAPAKLSRDAATIDQWIDRLASAQPGERRVAQLRLQDGGKVAIQRLIDRLLAGDPKVAPVMLAGTVAEFGPEGEDALRAACIVPVSERAGRVYVALAQLPGGAFSAELGAALSSRVLPVAVQTQLAEILTSRFGSVPKLPTIHAHLEKKFESALAEYQLQRSSERSLDEGVWRPTADGQTVQWMAAPAPARSLERLAQLAAHRLNSQVATPSDFVDCGTVLLQHAYQVQPTMTDGEIAKHLMVAFEDSLTTAAYWQQVFQQADDWQMHGASLRALQLLAHQAAEGKYLPPLGFLSDALRDPRPVIRYSALQAIAGLDPEQRYAGAETAIETALEMTRLTSGPQTLVIGLHSDLRQAAAQLLEQQVAATVTEVNSGQAALLALDGNKPIELIMVVDRVADLSIFELLQRLRNSKHGHSLPIAVLTDRLYQHERRLIGEMPGTIASVLSRDPAQMERVVVMLMDKLDTNPMSASDRGEFALAGGKFLATIASDRQRYAFYPLSDYREHLVSTQGGLTPASQMDVLAALGSAESQKKLAAMAASSSYSEPQRLAAAHAFGVSVRRFGMQLHREDVLQNYQIYNQFGPADPVTAKAIGLVLDVTEAQAGKAAWPEGL